MAVELFPHDESVLERVALVEPSGNMLWPEFASRISAEASSLSQGETQRVGLQLASTSNSLIRFFALVQSGAHVFLMSSFASKQEVTEWAKDLGMSSVIGADGERIEIDGEAKTGSPEAITILTSGTTGKPKAVQHTWESLVRPVRRSDQANGARWLLTFRPHLYAGLQVILQCLLNRGTLALAPADGDADSVVELAVLANVEFASATPSYWRWLLTFAGDKVGQMPLQQITLGGEAVDQATLDALHTAFPKSRLVHIYATTELGRCFSVTDGMAGFPSRFMDQVSPDGVQLQIDEGELIVRSANAMSGYDGSSASPKTEWFRTGDLVQQNGDRIEFVGRMTDMINVGGNKVYPVEVETFLREIPGVADCRVYGETSSIVGELVKCDIVLRDGFEADSVQAEIRQQALKELANYQRPRFISIVSEIPRTNAGKVKR